MINAFVSSGIGSHERRKSDKSCSDASRKQRSSEEMIALAQWRIERRVSLVPNILRTSSHRCQLLKPLLRQRMIKRRNSKPLDEPAREGEISETERRPRQRASDEPIQLRLGHFNLGSCWTSDFPKALNGKIRPVREELELPEEVVGHVSVPARRVQLRKMRSVSATTRERGERT